MWYLLLLSIQCTRIVSLNVYINDAGKKEFALKMGSLENALDEVKNKMEHDIIQRATAESTNKYSEINFQITVQPEIPSGFDLDACGLSIPQLSDISYSLHKTDPSKNILVFSNCDSAMYNDEFRRAQLKTPLIVQSNNVTGLKNMLTFVIPERAKFEATMADALMAAAGAPTKNPVTIQEDDGGDAGVQITYYYDNTAYELMQKEGTNEK